MDIDTTRRANRAQYKIARGWLQAARSATGATREQYLGMVKTCRQLVARNRAAVVQA